jgi:hypothetical protein
MLGIDVDVLVHAKATADLEAVARRLGAIAALRVEVSPPAILLWVDPAVMPPGVSAETRVADPALDRDPALLALRAVEVLRARLVKVPLATLAAPPLPSPDASANDDASDAAEPADASTSDDAALDASAATAPPEPPATSSLEAGVPALALPTRSPADDAAPPVVRAERVHSIGLSMAPAALLSPGGVPPALEIRLGGEWDPIPRIGIEALAFIPATAGTASAPDGSVDLRMLAFGGGVRGLITDPGSPFVLTLDGGASAVLLSFAGKASPPLRGAPGPRGPGAPPPPPTAAYRVHQVLSLRVDLLAAVVLPEPALRVDGKMIASFGLPAVLPSLGIEVRP